jgi:hypothetical protein
MLLPVQSLGDPIERERGILLESIGGAGYDRFNDGSRIETLTTIHGFATPLAGIALPIAAGAIIVAAGSAFSERMRRRRAGV